MPKMTKNSVCCTSYLRNHISYDGTLDMVHQCKLMNLLSFFFFFSFFQIFWVGRGVKGQKQSKIEKILSVIPYMLGTIHHMILIYGTHVQNDSISRVFFTFFPNFSFQGQQWGKRAKMAQNDKKLSFTLHISGSIHRVIVIFGTYV